MLTLNKPYYLLLVGVLLSFGLLGCSASQSQKQLVAEKGQAISVKPGWIHQPPQRLGYAYGVASSEIYGSEARALETASEKAKADLLAGIRVEISSSTDYSKSATMEFQGGMSLKENLNQEISSKTPSVELSGIKVSETWVDAKNKEAWALAELNTQDAAQQLLLQLTQLEERLLQRGTLPKASKLERIRYLKPSLQALAERRQILQQLTFLGAATQVDAARAQAVEKVEVEITQLLASLGVELQLTTSEAKALQAKLASALTNLGFNLVSHDSDLRLVIQFKSNKLEQNGLSYVDVNASAQINSANNRTLHVINAAARAVSSELNVAKNKAENELAEKLASALIESLYENL